MGQDFSAMANFCKSSKPTLAALRTLAKPKQSKSSHNRSLIISTTALGTLATLALVLVLYRTAFHEKLDVEVDDVDKIEEGHEDQEVEKRQVSPSVLDLLEANKTPNNRDFIFIEDDEQQQQHKILLVGEGDFSFSASLALSSPSASNMVATSLNSRDFLYRNYHNAMKNIDELRRKGCTIIHGIDATEMAKHDALSGMLFDRIIFNFPHAGFFRDESSESIRRHQMLVMLFLENASKMIKEEGEIHVTHKCRGFFQKWDIQGLASNVGLRLIEEVPFDFTDYPGYQTKYGFGGDKNFHCNPSKTYKFGF